MDLLLVATLACSAAVAHFSATDDAVRESCLVGEIQRRFLSALQAAAVTSCLYSSFNTVLIFQ